MTIAASLLLAACAGGRPEPRTVKRHETHRLDTILNVPSTHPLCSALGRVRYPAMVVGEGDLWEIPKRELANHGIHTNRLVYCDRTEPV